MILIILFLITTNLNALEFEWNDSYENYKGKIEHYLSKRFITTNPKKYQGRLYHKALTFVPIILEVCSQADVNPILVSSIISYESNWELKAIDKTEKAKGLLQVQFYEVDLNDPKDQIETGVQMLKNAFIKCGSINGALSYYATGQSCNGHKKGALRRINLAKHIEAIKLEKLNENL